jgi:hypothetical protein
VECRRTKRTHVPRTGRALPPLGRRRVGSGTPLGRERQMGGDLCWSFGAVRK